MLLLEKKRAAFCLHRLVLWLGVIRGFPHLWEFVRVLWVLIGNWLGFVGFLVGGADPFLGISWELVRF